MSNLEQDIEIACAMFMNSLAIATKQAVKDTAASKGTTLEEQKAFATGVMCAVDGMTNMLIPTLKAIIQKNQEETQKKDVFDSLN
jgi:hypothetical protein